MFQKLEELKNILIKSSHNLVKKLLNKLLFKKNTNLLLKEKLYIEIKLFNNLKLLEKKKLKEELSYNLLSKKFFNLIYLK